MAVVDARRQGSSFVHFVTCLGKIAAQSLEQAANSLDRNCLDKYNRFTI